MGGYGSGRSGGRPTIEVSLTLNLAKLMRDKLFRPSAGLAGSIVWTNTATAEKVATIGYQAFLFADQGRVRLHYTTTRQNGDKHPSDYWIKLTTTPQPFGGQRWWFICPSTGRRAAKLHLPTGALTFASRRAYRLGYRSQRETDRDRALGRAFKLRSRLGSNDGIGDYIPKPKGMHQITYEHHMAKVDAAEEVVEEYTRQLIERIDRRALR